MGLVSWQIAAQTQRGKSEDKLQLLKKMFTPADDLHSFLATLSQGEIDTYWYCYLMPGDYRLNETIEIKAHRLTLEGQNARLFGGIKIEADECSIKNLVIDRVGITESCIEFTGSYLEIRDCRLINGAYSIYGTGSYNRIKNNFCLDAERTGIYIVSGESINVNLNTMRDGKLDRSIYYAEDVDNSIIGDNCVGGLIEYNGLNNIYEHDNYGVVAPY